MRLFVKITSLCIIVAKDLSPNAKEMSKFQSQRDRREANSLIIFIICHLLLILSERLHPIEITCRNQDT